MKLLTGQLFFMVILAFTTCHAIPTDLLTFLKRLELSSAVNERDVPPKSTQDVVPDFETGEAKPEVEGVIVVDGDELMMQEEFKHFYRDADAKPKRDAIGDSSFYWPNGRIPYEIDSSAQHLKAEIKQAINKWEKYTCLKFEEVSSRSKAFRILFKDCGGNQCNSMVGYQYANFPNHFPQHQRICVFKGFCSQYGIIHEIGHAIGLHHEMSRPDRDRWITFNWDNTNRDKNSGDFGVKDNINYRGIPYDYYSTMHYGKLSWSKNGKPVIITKDPAFTNRIGRHRISPDDAKVVNLMYNCPNTGVTPFLRENVCTSWSKRTSVKLACPEGQRIEIDNAFYGFWGNAGKAERRKAGKACGFFKGDCKDFTEKPSCGSERICTLGIGKSTFHWKCKAYHDYYQIEYKCVKTE